MPAWPEPELETGAYVQDVTTSTAVVAMITSGKVTLEATLEGAGGTRLASDTAPRRRHALAFAGLAAGSEYAYVVREKAGAVRDRGSFRTAPAGADAKVRFCVVGDSGSTPPWIWMQRAPAVRAMAALSLLPGSSRNQAIGAAMAAERPDFWLHVGDVVYPHGEEKHYREAFFRPFAELLRHAPCFPVLGNHDLGNDPDYDDGGRPYLRSFVLPAGATTGDERCYSFAWGPIRLIALDLHPLAPLPTVTEDHPALEHLRKELAAATEPWKIVYGHPPLWSGSRQGRGRPELLKLVKPLLEQAKVDVYLAGHDHVYQRFKTPGGLVQVVSGGGGKSLYELVDHPWLEAAAAEYHYCIVEVEGSELRLRALTAGGKQLDEFVIHKH